MRITVIFGIILILQIGCNKPTTGKEGDAPIAAHVDAQGIYPHSAEFKTPQGHGAAFFANRNVCAQCHGLDFSGGQAKVSCMNCHKFPHPQGWAVPKNHGGFFMGLKRDERGQCLTCHTSGMTATAVSCGACHLAYPHAPGIGSKHGKENPETKLKPAEDLANKCFSCHGDNTKYACSNCHEEADDGKFRGYWKKPPEPPEKEKTSSVIKKAKSKERQPTSKP